ncbi:MAG TPA: ADP/ATP-dependent (S)-NAD(P)H-hydrate dehydratase, partial [Gemmatimonas sp.]|nr:ADP/ATP-dependent (S)-NAD(P)H-hydrate dehydratase [Gemmatimonas sp.]
GAGLVHAYVAAPGIAAVQQGAPQAIALPWPSLPDADHTVAEAAESVTHARTGAPSTPWGDALAIGPGLGRSPASLALLQHALEHALHPNAGRAMVLDADALTLATIVGELAGDKREPADIIAQWTLGAGQVMLTPHPGEFARLIGKPVPADWSHRAGELVSFAIRTRASVLLKGTPTLVATPDGAPPTVVARGTALLATGGSGDLLTGIIAGLLAGGLDARDAAILGATVHGLGAEIATRGTSIRGLTLEAVLASLPDAWRELAHPATFHKDVLSEFPKPVG